MKAIPLAVAVVGLALIAALLLHFGAGLVARSLVSVGFAGFAAVGAIQLALIALMGLAWWLLLLPGANPWAAIWARAVRDSASEVLPLSQLGGYVLGARALAISGVAADDAAASTIVDVTLEFFAQLAYVAVALLWLLHIEPHSRAAPAAAGGLALGLALAGGFVAAQHSGLGVLDRLAGSLGRGWAVRSASGAAALHRAIGEIYGRASGILSSFGLHLAAWVASAAQIWLALRWMGQPRGFGAVLVIESILYAIRSVAFAVPNAVGVQESAYLMLGAGFGLPPDVALALSLLKRARDFAIGLPVLGAYQLVESGRLWRFIGKVFDRLPVEPVKTPAAAAGVSVHPPRRKRRERSASFLMKYQGDTTMQAKSASYPLKLQ
jgi:glycosyltransferase 2 family protein